MAHAFAPILNGPKHEVQTPADKNKHPLCRAAMSSGVYKPIFEGELNAATVVCDICGASLLGVAFVFVLPDCRVLCKQDEVPPTLTSYKTTRASLPAVAAYVASHPEVRLPPLQPPPAKRPKLTLEEKRAQLFALLTANNGGVVSSTTEPVLEAASCGSWSEVDETLASLGQHIESLGYAKRTPIDTPKSATVTAEMIEKMIAKYHATSPAERSLKFRLKKTHKGKLSAKDIATAAGAQPEHIRVAFGVGILAKKLPSMWPTIVGRVSFTDQLKRMLRANGTLKTLIDNTFQHQLERALKAVQESSPAAAARRMPTDDTAVAAGAGSAPPSTLLRVPLRPPKRPRDDEN